jgi:hypothetical protein
VTPAEIVADALLHHENGTEGEGGPFKWGAHADHRYHAFCAVCQGDVETMARWAVEALGLES